MSKKRTVIVRIIYILMAATVIGGTATWCVMRDGRPWMALFVAGCCGVMVANLAILLIFVRRNIR
jgi:hypothetical protein